MQCRHLLLSNSIPVNQPDAQHVAPAWWCQHDRIRHLCNRIMVHHRKGRAKEAVPVGHGRSVPEHGSGLRLLDTRHCVSSQGRRCRSIHIHCEFWSKLVASAMGSVSPPYLHSSDILTRDPTALPSRNQPHQNPPEGQRPFHLLQLALQFSSVPSLFPSPLDPTPPSPVPPTTPHYIL